MTTHTPDEPDPSHTTAPSDEDETPAILAGSHVVSALRTASTRVESWVRNSALYRWLTAEPDPDVIVIDLRETWTVGPFLRVLDWVIDRLLAAADDSRAVAATQRGAVAVYAAPIRAAGFVIATIGLLVAVSSFSGDLSIIRVGIGVGIALAGLVAMQDDHDWPTLRETRPVQLLIAALEPPDPPENFPRDDGVGRTDDPEAETQERPPETDARDGGPDDR